MFFFINFFRPRRARVPPLIVGQYEHHEPSIIGHDSDTPVSPIDNSGRNAPPPPDVSPNSSNISPRG